MDSVKIMDASVSHENDYHGCHERNQKWGFKDKIDSSRFFCGSQIKVIKFLFLFKSRCATKNGICQNRLKKRSKV